MRIVADGIRYAVGGLVGGAVVAWLTGAPLLALPFFIFGVFCLWFFRDPERVVPEGPVAVSPADGKVMAVEPEQNGITRVSIFLNIFDVHVNRTPVSGTIESVQYKTGQFLVASKEVASSANEQNVVSVRMQDGVKVTFKQIAGVIARRIVFNKQQGDMLRMGERIGLMKFGSRMDVLLGPEWQILVRPRDRVLAGTSLLARRTDASS